ncbi:MAG: hypothetical protein DRI89_15350 [Bacteroidetes bacterium]|nr:MAG: hypothetical protein DRI89_15350 [Bacteroidota bacterium]
MFRKLSLLFSLCFLFSTIVFSQNQQKIDSLIRIASTSTVDTNLVKTYERIALLYLRMQLDSTKIYAQKMIDVSKKLSKNEKLTLLCE